MQVLPIMEQARIHCFYDSAGFTLLLPKHSFDSTIPHSRPLVAGVRAGANDLYEKTIKKYDPSVKLETFRDQLVAGESVDLSKITNGIVKSQDAQVFSPGRDANILHYRTRIEALEETLNRLQKKYTKHVLIDTTKQRIEQVKDSMNRFLNMSQKKDEPAQKQISIPAASSVDSESDESDESINDVDVDSDEPSSSTPVVRKPVIRKESRELTETREELMTERMGQNRPSVIHNLRQRLTDLEAQHVEQHNVYTMPTRREITEDNIFEQLEYLRWMDRDEAKMAPAVLNKIPIQQLNEMYTVMLTMAQNLQTALAEHTGVVENMEPTDQKNFLFHVIAKGKNLYYQSLVDPDFCLYLADNWQPLYSFMKKKLNR